MLFLTRIFADVLRRFRAHPYWYGGGILVLLAAAGLLFFSGNGNGKETLVIEKKDFVEQVSVSGNVIAARSAELGFAQSGRIAAVYSRVGQTVPVGTVLAAIENGDIEASVAQKKAALAREEAKLDALLAGVRSEEIAVKESAVAAAEVTLLQARAATVNAIKDAYAKSENAVRNQADQFFTNIQSAKPQLTFQTTGTQYSGDAESGRIVVEQVLRSWQTEVLGLFPGSNVEVAAAHAGEALAALRDFLTKCSAALNHAIPSSSVSQANINGYAADIALERATNNTVTSALTSAETTRKNAESSLDTARKNLLLAQAGSTKEDINAQKAQVSAARADADAARAALGKTLIAAPFGGTVAKMDATVGETAASGAVLITLLSSGAFQIETYIPEVEIAAVAAGNPAVVTLDAYGDASPFEASVIAIDPAETVKNGISTYKTTLTFAKTDGRIRSGMTANVVITTSRKENAVVIPSGAVFSRGGAKYVKVIKRRNAAEVAVTVGATNALGETEILSGLSEGDVLILNP